ncbi:hypothetical protein [Chitinibacter sp. S2-10]|uniref:hypothetical protein n=1 Tax=Chitinibacter sp. S2-10 TaxID=3373597 RepID=UPI0039779B7A
MALIISFLLGLLVGVVAMQLQRKTADTVRSKTPVAPQMNVEPLSVLKEAWLAALGGEKNVQQAQAIAATRVRVSLQDGNCLDEAALTQSGVQAVVPINAQVFHLIVGPQAV